jgi:hypothetical protein
LLLTTILRPAIARHVPLALLDAPSQGTGKSLLSDVVPVIATGSSAAILTMSDSEEELQKAITSLLLEGSTIITIDNITGRLQSKHLDGVLTSMTWKGPILGQSKMTKVPHRATWIATGNNIRLQQSSQGLNHLIVQPFLELQGSIWPGKSDEIALSSYRA